MGNGRVKGKEKGRGGEGRKGNRVRGKRKKGMGEGRRGGKDKDEKERDVSPQSLKRINAR